MYCENIAAQNLPGSEQYNWSTLTLCDFWSKVTPNILQLICSSKQVFRLFNATLSEFCFLKSTNLLTSSSLFPQSTPSHRMATNM